MCALASYGVNPLDASLWRFDQTEHTEGVLDLMDAVRSLDPGDTRLIYRLASLCHWLGWRRLESCRGRNAWNTHTVIDLVGVSHSVG